ncbi:hypothetical protein ACEQPO_21885 [Bacillus sp. SL00103]
MKGQKDISHPNRQMTPDTIGLFVSYLVNKFLEGQKELVVFDPGKWEQETYCLLY